MKKTRNVKVSEAMLFLNFVRCVNRDTERKKTVEVNLFLTKKTVQSQPEQKSSFTVVNRKLYKNEFDSFESSSPYNGNINSTENIPQKIEGAPYKYNYDGSNSSLLLRKDRVNPSNRVIQPKFVL